MKRFIGLLLFTSISFLLNAQISIRGNVFDFDTKLPVSCAEVYISTDYTDESFTTNNFGNFEFYDIEEGQEVFISINHKSYYSKDISFIANNDTVLDIEVYNIESENYKIEDLTKEDVGSVSIITLMYAPSTDFKTTFLSSFPLSFYRFDFRTQLGKTNQLGFNFSLFELAWYELANKNSLTTTQNIKERYFITSGSIYTYYRQIFTKHGSKGSRGLFLDLGIGYTLPYYSAYSYFINEDSRYTMRRIYKYNDINAFVRLGYANVAFIAKYSFNDVMKSGYYDIPKFSLGIDFPLNTY